MERPCTGCRPKQEDAAAKAPDNFGRTPLMKAARDGHAECVKALIKQGADVNAVNKNGSTALIRAADKGNVDCVSLLIKAGAGVNKSNTYGVNAVISASHGGHVDCVRILLKARGECWNTKKKKKLGCQLTSALYYAVVMGEPKIVDLLLKAGASTLRKDNLKESLLMIACQYNLPGHFRCVELLINAGADVNVSSPHAMSKFDVRKSEETMTMTKPARTPLAAAGNHRGKLRLLIRAGADVNSTDTDGTTELMFAAAGGHINSVKILLANGADVHARENQGKTALSYAAMGHVEIHLLSVYRYFNPFMMNIPNDGVAECMQLMIDAGADVNVKDSKGMAPVHIATVSTNIQCIQQLIKANADINTVDDNNISPIFFVDEVLYALHVDRMPIFPHLRLSNPKNIDQILEDL